MQKKGLMEEIQHAKDAGVAIDIQGVSYNQKKPEELWRVLQQGNYMLDYEGDENGHVVALQYVKVYKISNLKNKPNNKV